MLHKIDFSTSNNVYKYLDLVIKLTSVYTVLQSFGMVHVKAVKKISVAKALVTSCTVGSTASTTLFFIAFLIQVSAQLKLNSTQIKLTLISILTDNLHLI